MEQKIIFATTNEGKMREIKEILSDLPMEVLSMKEAGINMEIIEDGSTFEENALIKAKAVWEKTGHIVLADDSGLEIDHLNSEPGIYSARYLGDAPYTEKNRVLIERLCNVRDEERSARFRCVIAAVLHDGSTVCREASMEGIIAHEPAGEGGFGYDPILYLPECNKTSSQLTMEEKNSISHRGKALKAMKEKLRELYGERE